MVYPLRLMGGCNNRCRHCMVAYEIREGKHTPFERLRRIIDEHRDDLIDVYGGEPTIHPEFFKILEYMKSQGITYRLASNARLFCNEEFTKRVSQIGVGSIRSSIYGHTPEIHESITTVPGSFEQSIGGFKNIIKYKIPLMVNIVILKPNYRHLKDITKMLVDLGVARIKYASLVLKGRGYDNRHELAARISDIKPHLNEALDLAKSSGVRFVIEKNPICIAPRYHQNFIKESDPSVDPAVTFSKSPECSKCRFDNSCVGVSIRYQELFGLSELVPL